MPISAQLFEYDFFRHLHIYCQVILPCLHLRLFWRAKNIAEKMDTNAQWFHSSWSILPQRVNIRVHGFHLVFFTLYHGKSPLHLQFGLILFIFYRHLKQIQEKKCHLNVQPWPWLVSMMCNRGEIWWDINQCQIEQMYVKRVLILTFKVMLNLMMNLIFLEHLNS